MSVGCYETAMYFSKKKMRKSCCYRAPTDHDGGQVKRVQHVTTYYITHEPSHMYKYFSKKKMRKTCCTGGHKTMWEAVWGQTTSGGCNYLSMSYIHVQHLVVVTTSV